MVFICTIQVARQPSAAGDSMEELFWDLAHGLLWERFCRVFVQCLVCKSVAFREGLFLHHCCAAPRPSSQSHRRHAEVVGDENTRSSRVRVRLSKVNGRLTRVRVQAGDQGRTYNVQSRSSRRAPPHDSDTEIIPDSEPEAEERDD